LDGGALYFNGGVYILQGDIMARDFFFGSNWILKNKFACHFSHATNDEI